METNGRWACLQWLTAVCLLGFVYSVLALFSLLINIKKTSRDDRPLELQEWEISFRGEKKTNSLSFLPFFLILSSFWSFYVVVTSMLQQLYGHSRLEAMLLSWQHLVEEKRSQLLVTCRVFYFGGKLSVCLRHTFKHARPTNVWMPNISRVECGRWKQAPLTHLYLLCYFPQQRLRC